MTAREQLREAIAEASWVASRWSRSWSDVNLNPWRPTPFAEIAPLVEVALGSHRMGSYTPTNWEAVRCALVEHRVHPPWLPSTPSPLHQIGRSGSHARDGSVPTAAWNAPITKARTRTLIRARTVSRVGTRPEHRGSPRHWIGRRAMNVEQTLMVSQLPSECENERFLNVRLQDMTSLGWRAISMVNHNGMLVFLMERASPDRENGT